MQIDPMADFFVGINPYNFAFNNPISLVDPDGLGPFDWLKKLFGGRGRHGDQASRQAKRSQRKNNARGAKRPHRGRGGNPATMVARTSTPTTRPNTPTYSVSRRGPEFGLAEPNFNPNLTPVDIPANTIDIPVFRDQPIPARTRMSFSEKVDFVPMTTRFESYKTAKSQLTDLVELTIKNPQIFVFIVGNVGGSGAILGNSNKALDQTGFTLNGEKVTARTLMNARARAVYNFLIDQGVNPSQLSFGPGSVIDGMKGVRVSFEIRNNGN